jgi:uncharacterized protein
MPKVARTTCMLVTGALLLGAPAAAQAASLDRGDASVSRVMARAQRGDAHAQAVLGFMYANGNGVPQSYNLAVEWYKKSAWQGDTEGQYLLGLMYDKGFGIKADVIQAYKWLDLAASHAPYPNRDNFLRMRDAVGSKMTPGQLEIAQKLAVDFVPARW